MSKKETKLNPTTIAEDVLVSKIYEFRGHKIMLDRDLANLYGVETRVLKQAVRRNIDRFPEDFMFELTKEEYDIVLRSQNASLEQGRYSPRWRTRFACVSINDFKYINRIKRIATILLVYYAKSRA